MPSSKRNAGFTIRMINPTIALVMWFLYFFVMAYAVWFQFWAWNIAEKCEKMGCPMGQDKFLLMFLRVAPALLTLYAISQLAGVVGFWLDISVFVLLMSFLVSTKVFLHKNAKRGDACRDCVSNGYTNDVANMLFYIFSCFLVIFTIGIIVWKLQGKGGI